MKDEILEQILETLKAIRERQVEELTVLERIDQRLERIEESINMG